MNNFTKQLESFESPEDYAEFKKNFFSKENKQYMNYVDQMEKKYGTKNFEKVLDKMNDREYNHHTKLFSQNPLLNKGATTTQRKVEKQPTKQTKVKTYTKSQFDGLSVNELRKIAEKTAVAYYKSGASGISFGNVNIEDVAKQLAKQGTATSLKKDILAMQKKMNKK